MGIKTRFSAVVLTACMALSALPATAYAEGTAKSTVTRINVQGERAAAYMVISKEFAAKDQNVKLVYNANEQAGDILVDTQGNGYETTYGTEGYGIATENGIVTVKAAGTAGAAYGLRDVLRQLESDGAVEDKAISAPGREMRALFVDCARKYFSVEWFETIIREMAWNGMNTMYMSFSNDEGFRFLLDDMSVSFEDANGSVVEYDHEFMKHLGDNPHTISDSEFLAERNEGASNVAQEVLRYDSSEYLTQDEMVQILTYAKAYGINIIPEFNSPGHTGQILWYFPEYRNVGIWGIGSNPCYAMNLENVEAKNFMSALIEKYVDFFYENGCTDFCVGGDEFAANGSTNETIAAYVNGLVDYVESKGMTAYAWADGQSASSGLLKKSAIVNDWNSNGSAASNYQVVNFNSDYLYHVLKVGDWWKVNPKNVFETWNPLLFQGNSALAPDSEAAANVLGACIAVWCDDANAKEASVILTEMMTNLKAFGYRVWNYDPAVGNTITYEEFIAGATDAAVLKEADVLGAVSAVEEILRLESQLEEAEGNAVRAQTAAENAQKVLTAAEGRVTAAEQKVAAAVSQKDVLTAEVELYTARAEANKLAAEAAVKYAEAAEKKAAVSALSAQIIALDGNTEDAAAKEAESKNLEEEALRQKSTAEAKQNAQAELDKAVEAKKAQLAGLDQDTSKEPEQPEQPEQPKEPVTTATVKNISYKILNAGKKTAAVTGTTNKNLKTAVIQNEVSIDGITYKVTQIKASAFKGLKKLEKVTIGSNVQVINKQAFAQCGKLTSINMKKAKGITSIKGNAFKKISAKAKVTVPAGKKTKYKKLLKNAGLPKKATVK